MGASTVNADLRKILLDTLAGYAVKGLNGESYLTTDLAGSLFTVLSVGHFGDERIVDTGLVVRLLPDAIVIEHDANDKPLVDALVQAGVPRQTIILAYAGETVPERA
jgi:hypothetical protein